MWWLMLAACARVSDVETGESGVETGETDTEETGAETETESDSETETEDTDTGPVVKQGPLYLADGADDGVAEWWRVTAGRPSWTLTDWCWSSECETCIRFAERASGDVRDMETSNAHWNAADGYWQANGARQHSWEDIGDSTTHDHGRLLTVHGANWPNDPDPDGMPEAWEIWPDAIETALSFTGERIVDMPGGGMTLTASACEHR